MAAIPRDTNGLDGTEQIETPHATNNQIDPGLIKLAEIFKDGFLKYQEKDIEALKIELKDRKHVTIIIVSAMLAIILSIVYLTIIGKFEMTTFTFLLGTAVGSMLTILAKMYSGTGE